MPTTPTTQSGRLELVYYYGAGGQFPRYLRVDSIEQAETALSGKHYHSAELFEPTSRTPIKTWERQDPLAEAVHQVTDGVVDLATETQRRQIKLDLALRPRKVANNLPARSDKAAESDRARQHRTPDTQQPAETAPAVTPQEHNRFPGGRWK